HAHAGAGFANVDELTLKAGNHVSTAASGDCVTADEQHLPLLGSQLAAVPCGVFGCFREKRMKHCVLLKASGTRLDAHHEPFRRLQYSSSGVLPGGCVGESEDLLFHHATALTTLAAAAHVPV